MQSLSLPMRNPPRSSPVREQHPPIHVLVRQVTQKRTTRLHSTAHSRGKGGWEKQKAVVLRSSVYVRSAATARSQPLDGLLSHSRNELQLSADVMYQAHQAHQNCDCLSSLPKLTKTAIACRVYHLPTKELNLARSGKSDPDGTFSM